MHPDESPSNTRETSTGVEPGGAPADGRAAIGVGRRVPVWILAIGGALVASMLSGLGGESIERAVPVTIVYPADFSRVSGYEKAAVLTRITGEASQMSVRKKAAAAYGLLGILLGSSLGLAGILKSGSFRSGIAGVLVAAVSGGVVAAAAAWMCVPVFFRFQDPTTDATATGLILLSLVHAAIFAGIGAAGGLALGRGLGQRIHFGPPMVGGLLGAILGTVLFEVINSVVYPLVRTYEPVPAEPVPRMLLQLCVAMGTAILAGLAVTSVGRPDAPGRTR